MNPVPAPPTPRPLAWMLIGLGIFLFLAAIGLTVLLFVVLPTPAGGLKGSVLFLFLVIAAMGAVSVTGGAGALRTGRMSPALRTASFVLGAMFLGACWANIG